MFVGSCPLFKIRHLYNITQITGDYLTCTLKPEPCPNGVAFRMNHMCGKETEYTVGFTVTRCQGNTWYPPIGRCVAQQGK